jgi:TonB-dependent SusC/RagA subfamily outer membrane receptor
MRYKFSLLTGILLMTGYLMQAYSQEKIVSGKITTFDSIPLIKATVKVKGTKLLVYSDTTGLFSISCKPGDKLYITAEGFNGYNVKIDEKTKYVLVNLQLRPGKENIEYAIGYGHVKEKDKLYAISSLRNGDIDFAIYRDMFELLKGRFPGVSVQNNEIIIRGTKSINSSNAALIVVDGMVTDTNGLLMLSPNDVESIDILKDASSSIYGSRGANGVVIVETKSGGPRYKK